MKELSDALILIVIVTLILLPNGFFIGKLIEFLVKKEKNKNSR